MTWKQKLQPQDPDWVEFHKEVISPTKGGRGMLKIWLVDSYWGVSFTLPKGTRCRGILMNATNREEAKAEALEWVGVAANG